MFNNSKYTRWYFILVNFRKENKPEGIVENHHIIPKSMGGSDDTSNIVALTPREHFICHLLLPKMCVDEKDRNKMYYARHALMNGIGRQERYNSKHYNIFKRKFCQLQSERYTGEGNPFYGKTHKEESKRYGNANSSTRPEVREKLKGPRPNMIPHNAINGWSEETKQKISNSLKGKPLSDQRKAKMKLAKQNLVWINNGIITKQINIAQLDEYLDKDFVRGRGPKSIW